MSETTLSLRRKIDGATDLQSVVRSMKALASSSIGQYEKSVRALGDYYHAVELGLCACFHAAGATPPLNTPGKSRAAGTIGVVIFGSDQGLVGRFNDDVADFAVKTLGPLSGKPQVWAVGERVHGRLQDVGLAPTGQFAVPTSVKAIAPLVGQILVKWGAIIGDPAGELHLFYNRPVSGGVYKSVHQRLSPLDEQWRRAVTALPWPSKILPEVMGSGMRTLAALIGEYLFVSLFRASAESLASENASRLLAMQRADKNINELLETLRATFHRLRQNSIDEELFDVVSGFEALSGKEN